MNGIINIYKEKGFTSFDVVGKLRGILHTKKIGHTGTLDPDATGVLPVCVGNATKCCEFLSDHDKEYVATMQLGIVTDTQDISGNVLSDNSIEGIPEYKIRDAIISFVGEYSQIPPMYSAKKVNGKKLYEYAREGKVIERKPAIVNIFEIEILSVELPYVKMRVQCSKGTYIRTLCHDIGQKLGCGAGDFDIKSAIKLSEVEALAKQERTSYILMDTRKVFYMYPSLQLKPIQDKTLYNGNPLDLSGYADVDLSAGKICIYDSEGIFRAVYDVTEDGTLCKPYKMFLG